MVKFKPNIKIELIMFSYAKKAWNIVDNNEPQISNYFLKEIFKFLPILITTILFLVIQLPLIPIIVIIALWIMLRMPYILAEALNLMQRSFIPMDVIKIKSIFISKRFSFYFFSFPFLSIITGLVLVDPELLHTKFSCFRCLIKIIGSLILLKFYIVISALFLFSKNSLWQSINKSKKMVIYIPRLLKIVLLDLILGYLFLLSREVFRRITMPMTILSYSQTLRLLPFTLASIGILYQEFFGLDEIINFETVQSLEKLEEIDSCKLHLSLEASPSKSND